MVILDTFSVSQAASDMLAASKGASTGQYINPDDILSPLSSTAEVSISCFFYTIHSKDDSVPDQLFEQLNLPLLFELLLIFFCLLVNAGNS